MRGEIDEIFGAAGRAKSAEAPPSTGPRQPKGALKGAPGDRYDVRGAAVDDTYRCTPDGHRIYSAQELRVGQGKGTPACPFDCDCCF